MATTPQSFIPATSSISDPTIRAEINQIYTQLRNLSKLVGENSGGGGDSYVPTSRTVNGHALSSDVTITKGDVGLGSVVNVASYSITAMDTKLNDYLLSATAASTYLTSIAAAAAYLTKTDASSTYLTQANANSNFLTKTLASTTYLTQANASATYLPTVTAASTYVAKTFTINGKALSGTAITIAAGDLSDVYSKTQIDSKVTVINADIALKADRDDLDTLSTAVGTKANSVDVAYLVGAAFTGNVTVGSASVPATFSVPNGLTTLSTATINGALTVGGAINGGSIELSLGTPYIDFHFGSSAADYTHRIIADGATQLSILAAILRLTGDVNVAGYVNAKVPYVKMSNPGTLTLASGYTRILFYTGGDNVQGMFNETDHATFTATKAGIYKFDVAYQHTTGTAAANIAPGTAMGVIVNIGTATPANIQPGMGTCAATSTTAGYHVIAASVLLRMTAGQTCQFWAYQSSTKTTATITTASMAAVYLGQ